MAAPKRLVVGISGATGIIYGIRLLEVLRPTEIETHLVMSPSARLTLAQETDWKVRDVIALADVNHEHNNIGASIASGSFETAGMIIAPCTIKTLSAVANCYTKDLIARAADVTLKEGRQLLLMIRETPLHLGHLRLMVSASEMGAIIFPPVAAFYSRPQTLDDIINDSVGRALARMGIKNHIYFEWKGLNPE